MAGIGRRTKLTKYEIKKLQAKDQINTQIVAYAGTAAGVAKANS